jgi:hypothetical protein
MRIEPRPDVEVYSSTSVDLTLDRYLSVFKEDLAERAGVEMPIIAPAECHDFPFRLCYRGRLQQIPVTLHRLWFARYP